LTHEATADPVLSDEDTPPAPPATRGPRPLRLHLLEIVGVLGFYSALTFLFFAAMRDRGQAFYQELLVNGLNPDRIAGAHYVKQLEFPGWTRDSFGGAPFAAQIQHALYYPGNLPWAIFHNPSTALDLVVASSVVWCGFGMWAFTRYALKASYLASVFAGLAFGFGGMALQHVTLTNQLQSLSWMPFVLLFAHLALETKRWRYTVLTAASIGMGLLAGHPEEWAYTLGALGLYALAWVLGGVRLGRGALLRRAGSAVARIGSAFVLFLGLFGFQLLPTLALMSQGYRSGPNFAEQYPTPKESLVNTLLPDYGHVLTGENVAFIGILALALAGLGLVAGTRSPLWFRIWTVVLSVFGLTMALGNASPVYSFLYDHVSVVRGFRVPSRYLLLPSFGLAALSALGVDALLQDHRDSFKLRLRQGLLAVGALVVLAAIALTIGDLRTAGTAPSTSKWVAAALAGFLLWAVMSVRRVPAVPVALLLIVVACFELNFARPSGEYHQVAPNVVYNDAGAVLKDLGAADGRYLTIVSGPMTGADRASIDTQGFSGREGNYFLAAWPSRLSARPQLNLITGAQTVQGRDGGLLPLGAYRDFFLAAAHTGNINGGQFPFPPSAWNWKGLDLLSVESFVTSTSLPGTEAEVLRSHGFSIEKTVAYIEIWRRPAPPLARVFYDTDVVATREARVAALPTYPLLERALVNEPVNGLGTPTAPPVVKNTAVENNTVELDVTSSAKGLLVLADPYYPGWQATVNGKRQEILHADVAFRGVVVPSGHSTVVFTYHDSKRTLGLILLPLSLLGIAGAYVLRRRRVRA
jgi:hypothetical protein